MTTTIVTRAGKGAALTHAELDANFTNLRNTADATAEDARFPTADEKASFPSGASAADPLAKASDARFPTADEKAGIAGLSAADPAVPRSGLIYQAADYTALRAITGQTAGKQASVAYRSTAGDGGGGMFRWDSSDLSAQVAADTQSGIYVAPTSDATGASGAWVRQYSGAVFPKWFGATTTANSKPSIDAMVSVLVPGDAVKFDEVYPVSAAGISIVGKIGLTFYGPGGLKFDDGVSNGVLLKFDDCDNIVLDGVELDGNIAGGSEGDREALAFADVVGGCNKITVRNCNIHDTTASSVASGSPGFAANGVSSLTLINNRITDTDVSIQLRRCSIALIDGNYMAGGASESVSLWGDSSALPNTDIIISNNIALKPLQVALGTRVSVTGNIMNVASPAVSDMALGGGSDNGYAFVAKDVAIRNNSLRHRIDIGTQNASETGITAVNITIESNIWQLNDTVAILWRYKSDGVKVLRNNITLEQNASSIVSFGTDTNLFIEDNKINLNGFTAARFINTLAAAIPIQVKRNTLLGAPTSEAVWVRATTPGNVVSDNYLPGGYVQIDGAGNRVERNVTNRTGIESVASASTLVLYAPLASDDSVFSVTGTTGIANITTTRPGHCVKLVFTGVLTVTDGGNLRLAGDFTTAANSTLTLICAGSTWVELSRSSN